MSAIGWFLVAAGAICIVAGLLQRRKLGKLNSVPFRKPSEITQLGAAAADAKGLVSTEGAVVAPQPLIASMSGQPCVAYEITIERKWEREQKDDKGGVSTKTGTDTVHRHYEGTVFQLRDEVGAVQVDAGQRPDITLEKSHSNTERVGALVPHAMAFGQMQFQTPALPRDSRTVAFIGTERILKPNGNLFALGAIEPNAHGPVVTKPKGVLSSLLLSPLGRAELVRKTDRNSKLTFVAAGVLALVGTPMGIFGSHADAAVAPEHAITQAGTSSVTPAASAALTLGGPALHGTLQVSHHAAGSDQPSDDYALILTAGRPVTISTIGGTRPDAGADSPLDVVTALLCNGQEVARDDDGGGGLNSRIEYTPTASGPCTVRVMAFGAQIGEYTVQAGAAGALGGGPPADSAGSVCARAARCCVASAGSNAQARTACTQFSARVTDPQVCERGLNGFRQSVARFHRSRLSECN